MAQQTINIGSTPNDGTGDPLRTAMQKTNSNFTELYAADVSLDGRLDTAETNITTLDGRIDANDTTIADHETRLSGAEGDITANADAIDAVSDTLTAAQVEIGREIGDYRGIQALSASTTYDPSWLGKTINVDASGGPVTITLPTNLDSGQIVRIRKIDSGGSPVILTPFASTFANLNSQYEYVEALWNGTGWVPMSWNDLPYGSALDARVTSLEGLGTDPTLVALSGLNATAGLVEQTGPDTFAKRAIGVASATDILTRADGDGRYAAITYVDGLVQGLDVKASVRAASTANFANTTPTSTVLTATAVGALTLDGVAVAELDRVLLKNQTLPEENGIYIVTEAGDGATAAVLTRAADMNAWAEIPGAFTFVEEGTVNANAGWTCTADAGGTLGTTAINFTQFSGAGTYSATGGINLTGSTFSLRTEFNADSTTAYALVLADAGKHVTLTNAAAIALTVPKDATVNFPVGTTITIEQGGAGMVTLTPEDGTITINSLASNLDIAGQFGVVKLVKKAANLWTAYGDLA